MLLSLIETLQLDVSALFTAYVVAVVAAAAIATRRCLDRRETIATIGFLALSLAFAG